MTPLPISGNMSVSSPTTSPDRRGRPWGTEVGDPARQDRGRAEAWRARLAAVREAASMRRPSAPGLASPIRRNRPSRRRDPLPGRRRECPTTPGAAGRWGESRMPRGTERNEESCIWRADARHGLDPGLRRPSRYNPVELSRFAVGTRPLVFLSPARLPLGGSSATPSPCDSPAPGFHTPDPRPWVASDAPISPSFVPVFPPRHREFLPRPSCRSS
jgi:hypothetical protein